MDDFEKTVEPIVVTPKQEQIVPPVNPKDVEIVAEKVLVEKGDDVINKAIEDGKIRIDAPKVYEVEDVEAIPYDTLATLKVGDIIVYNYVAYTVNKVSEEDEIDIVYRDDETTITVVYYWYGDPNYEFDRTDVVNILEEASKLPKFVITEKSIRLGSTLDIENRTLPFSASSLDIDSEEGELESVIDMFKQIQKDGFAYFQSTSDPTYITIYPLTFLGLWGNDCVGCIVGAMGDTLVGGLVEFLVFQGTLNAKNLEL